MNIAILLTTYNGQNFLAEQLDSLIEQTERNWTLYIRDDVSTDNTVSIIKSYTQRDLRIKWLEDPVKRGAFGGFMWLLSEVTADYYMFCDQDDVWKSNKIELTLKRMMEVSKKGIPTIVGTDFSIVSSNLDIIHNSFRKYSHYSISQLSDKYFHLFYNNITGCTMMLNNDAKAVSLPYPDTSEMHDAWVAAAVLWKGGTIGYCDEPLMLYRQHEHNVSGVKLNSLLKKCLNIRTVISKTNRQFEASKWFVRMNYISFFLLKSYYMIGMLWRFNVLAKFTK